MSNSIAFYSVLNKYRILCCGCIVTYHDFFSLRGWGGCGLQGPNTACGPHVCSKSIRYFFQSTGLIQELNPMDRVYSSRLCKIIQIYLIFYGSQTNYLLNQSSWLKVLIENHWVNLSFKILFKSEVTLAFLQWWNSKTSRFHWDFIKRNNSNFCLSCVSSLHIPLQ